MNLKHRLRQINEHCGHGPISVMKGPVGYVVLPCPGAIHLITLT
jgi:hypothetical protein